MGDPLHYDYRRYLEAKRSVDDRSINRHVVDALCARIDRGRVLRVLEIGGGTGTMVRRSLARDLFGDVHYTLVDRDAEALAAFDARTRQDAEAAGYTLELAHADIGDFLSQPGVPYDLVIANAVLDLLDVPVLLAQLQRRCKLDAHLWFTINFDGESCFLPARESDQPIWHAYHESMNRGAGRRYAGRALLQTLVDSGATLLATGSSDWLVHTRDGAYPADESYFLHHIVHTIDEELASAPPIPAPAFSRWIAERHADIEAGKLIYLAHGLDVLSSAPRLVGDRG